MELIINLDQEQLATLTPALEDLGLLTPPNLISIDWHNPRRKESVYQVATESDLKQMTTEFNECIENAGIELRFKDPTDLSPQQCWNLLDWLNTNAQWSEDPCFIETWLEDDEDLMRVELNKNPELLVQS